MFELNSTVVSAITRELDFCALRHEVYSANIANVDVQGYRRLEVSRSEVAGSLDASSAALATGGGGSGSGEIVSTSDSVRLDQELAGLSKNALRYQVLLSAYEKTAGIFSAAIKEGRGE